MNATGSPETASETESLLLSRMHELLAGVPGPLVAGLSGGLDSSVLLHALVRAGAGERLTAVHVHHGLQSAAEDWAEHCRRQAQRLSVAFRLERASLVSGGNLEDRARRARYDALLSHLPEQGALVLAHHLDDQAETLLLRLLRGAGPRGLAAMAPDSHRDGRRLCRPLLEFSRVQLAAVAERWQLSWVEDPANQALEADRNFLRHRVLPLLGERWPAVAGTLARDAALQRDTAMLLDEVGDEDMARLGDPVAGVETQALERLSRPRRYNLLHGMIRRRGLPLPSSSVLHRVDEELLAAGADRQPEVSWPGGSFRRYRGRLWLLHPREAEPWSGQARLEPADGGMLQCGPQRVRVRRVRADGQPGLLFPLDVGPLCLAPARGGERILLDGMHRRLKELWRQAGVPPWQRRRLPVLYRDGEPVAAFAAGVADSVRVKPGDAAWQLEIEPDDPGC